MAKFLPSRKLLLRELLRDAKLTATLFARMDQGVADVSTSGVRGGPPGLPFKTFLNFIEYLGDVGVPQKIAREFWARKLAGSTGPLVINGLRFFDLIDENSYSKPQLEAISADPERRKAFFRDQLGKRYGAVLETVNLERATRGQLSEEFTRVFSVRGSNLVRAVIFFVHLARYTGVNVSSHIIVRERTTETAKRRKKNDAHRGARHGAATPRKEDSDEAIHSPPDTAPAQQSLLLWGLFKRLPKPGGIWPERERVQWLETLQNVITLEYRNE